MGQPLLDMQAACAATTQYDADTSPDVSFLNGCIMLPDFVSLRLVDGANNLSRRLVRLQ